MSHFVGNVKSVNTYGAVPLVVGWIGLYLFNEVGHETKPAQRQSCAGCL